MAERQVPIAFESAKQVSLAHNRYKTYSKDSGNTFMLFDLVKDLGETRDLAVEKPQILRQMKRTLEKWRASCKESLAGKDYR
ncbi:MAG: hypothetical protein JSU70_20685 [Phycisphaerales bacterium]|nr:MAG: hypothetical protein JSU70_20685 [Phycisphaerales bacterium]